MFSLALIEPNQNFLKVYKDMIPDLSEQSHFLILNNEADNPKYENVIQLKVFHLDDTANQTRKQVNHAAGSEFEQTIKILRLTNKVQQSKKKRAVTILKDEFIPSVNLDLTQAMSAFVEGEIIYFLFPGVILKYNITYNIFEEEVKIAESKFSSLIFYRYTGNAGLRRQVLLLEVICEV